MSDNRSFADLNLIERYRHLKEVREMVGSPRLNFREARALELAREDVYRMFDVQGREEIAERMEDLARSRRNQGRALYWFHIFTGN